MTYLDLEADRLIGIIDGLSSVVGTSLDPDEAMEAAARVARVVTSADGASIELGSPTVTRSFTQGEVDGAASSISVPLEYGARIGSLTVARSSSEGFDESDFEALRLVAPVVAAQIAHSLEYAAVSFESRVDQLTGLGNRLAFEERLGWELARATRYEEPISLVVFDIDDFGRLNDRYGIEECDRMLVSIAGTLSQGRAADSFFRIGPDEFATIMPNTSKEGAEIAAIRLGWSVAKLREQDSDLTVSTGVAQAEVPDPRVFFAEAEAALRADRNAGMRAAVSA